MEVSARTLPWVGTEMSDVKNSSIPALLFSTPRSPATLKIENMIIFNCFKIWQQFRKGCKLPDTSIHAPVYRNHAFCPSLSDGSFNSSRLKGFVIFFQYLQTKYYVCQCEPKFESLLKDKRVHLNLKIWFLAL